MPPRHWFLAGLTVIAACDCGGEPDLQSAPPARGVPSHPVVVRPELAPVAVEPIEVGNTRIRSAPTIPPIVRGPSQVDVFTQDEAIVDVLWIVDNSGTLTNEREQLAAEFDRFLDVLLIADVDFHVGVTSTDLDPITGDGGRLRGFYRFIDRTTPNPVEEFRSAVSFSNQREVALEQGLLAMETALSPPLINGANVDFLRPEAALAVIVVSDEDDSSLGPAQHYVRFLSALKEPGREANIGLYAVVGDPPDGCIPAGEEQIFGAEASPGDRYIEVAESTGGFFASICAADFAPFVEQLATSLAGLRTVFPLSAPPDPASLRVVVDGRMIPRSQTNGWWLLENQRAIIFSPNRVPPPGAEVRIEYDVAL